MWDIIEDAKPGRVIVLTTHSMEEADILGDRISIICRGRLQCIGNSLRLKQRFGTGYSISVACGSAPEAGASHPGGSHPGSSSAADAQLSGEDKAARARVRALFQEKLGVKPFEESYLYMQFLVPREREADLARFIGDLQAREKELRISDLMISLTTLEEVFLKIATQARACLLARVSGMPFLCAAPAPLLFCGTTPKLNAGRARLCARGESVRDAAAGVWPDKGTGGGDPRRPAVGPDHGGPDPVRRGLNGEWQWLRRGVEWVLAECG